MNRNLASIRNILDEDFGGDGIWRTLQKQSAFANEAADYVSDSIRHMAETIGASGADTNYLLDRAAICFVRFGLPVPDLAPHLAPSKLMESARLQVLFGLIWRLRDTRQDASDTAIVSDDILIEQSLLAAARSSFAAHAVVWNSEIESVINDMFVYHSIEREGDISPDEIWRRASPMMVVPKFFMRAPADKLAFYRDYMNLLGFLHDVDSFLSDFNAVEKTIPVAWYKDQVPSSTFSFHDMQIWFQRCVRHAEQLFDRLSRNCGDQMPAFRSLLDDAQTCFIQPMSRAVTTQ